MAHYSKHGIHFRYPDDWDINEERLDEGICVTVAGDGTAFWSVSLYEGAPRPEDVIETALEAFRDEYENLDEYPVESNLAGTPNVGRDIEFVSLDVLNTACVRSFRAGGATAFVLFQATDRDLEATREILEGISASLVCEPGE